MRSDLVDISLYWVRETEKAILFKETETSEAQVWLPKSMIEVVKTNHTGIFEVTMPESLAHEKGLI